MSLRIKIKKRNDIPVVQIIGEAVGQDVVKISKKLEPFLTSNEPVIAIDLGETTVVDSYGLGVFVFSWKQFTGKNRQLVFINPQGFVKELFEGTNLDKVLKISESIDSL
ncbi:MAG: STAS domain-containing protein [Chitinivibrionales bacterium]